MLNQRLDFRAYKFFEQQATLTHRQLSALVNISLGKLHYLLKALAEMGWFKLDNFQRSENRLECLYMLNPTEVSQKSAIAVRFLVLKKQEYKESQRGISQSQKEIQQQAPGNL